MGKGMRDWYFKGFRLSDNPADKTEPVYEGEYYAFDLDDEGLRRMKLERLISAAVLTALLAGCWLCPGNGARGLPGYIALLCLIPLIFLIWGSIALRSQAQPMIKREKHFSYDFLRFSGLVLSALLLAALISELVLCITHFGFATEVLYLCTLAITLAVSVWMTVRIWRSPLRIV